MSNNKTMKSEPITPATQEIVVSGFNPLTLQAAEASLAQKAEILDVNLSLRNWDTSKRQEFERSVYLGCDLMPAHDEKTGEEKQLECAFFMDAEKNIWYKAAYQFVKACKLMPVGANFYARFLSVEKISNGNKAETFMVKQYNLVGQ